MTSRCICIDRNGIDQRILNSWVGHTTEEMRRRTGISSRTAQMRHSEVWQLPLGDSKCRTEGTQALQTNGLQDVIVCGHVNCRTVGGQFLPKDRDSEWLRYGDKLRNFIESNYPNLDEKAKANVAVQENVLLQIEKELVSMKAANVEARVYGWIAEAISSHVYKFNPLVGQFMGS